ncbi:carbohydrate ABC transporter permease [Paenibacillus rhizoplanae]
MPYITSGVAVAFVWMLLFHPNNGPINGILRSMGIENPPGWLSTMDTSMYAIDIIWIWFMLGYNMIIYLAALQEVSGELLEAATIDGARTWQTVRSILWPLVSPTTFSAADHRADHVNQAVRHHPGDHTGRTRKQHYRIIPVHLSECLPLLRDGLCVSGLLGPVPDHSDLHRRSMAGPETLGSLLRS